MRLGPLEVVVTNMGDCFKYEVVDHRDGGIKTYGFRPNENGARNAGFDDASLMRTFT